MMADTPQTDEPTASKAVSFGVSLNSRPIRIIIAIDKTISIATRPRLKPPSFTTSFRRKRTPISTIPTFSQNS